MRNPQRRVRVKSAGPLGALAMVATAAISLAIPAAVLAASSRSADSKAPFSHAWAQHVRPIAHGRPGAIRNPRPNAAAWAVGYPFKLPTGYQSPTGIAADTVGNGVWLFAQGGDSTAPLDTVFYWSGSKLTAYQLDAADPTLQGGAQTPIVVDADGMAWIGDNRTLVSVNRQTGVITTFKLPDVAIAAPSSGLPVPPPMASAQDFTVIDALAISAEGSVVIARQFATEFQSFDPSTHQTTTLALPAGTILAGLGNDVAGQAGGEIAAVLYAGQGVHELGQYSNGQWTISQGPCPAYAVSMTASSVAVTGPDCIAVGTVSGTAEPARLSIQPASQTAGSEDQACAVSLASGTVAMCSPLGLAVAQPGSGTSTEVSLGQIVSAISAGPGGQTAGTASGLVALPITPGLMSAASSGDLWFVPAQGGTAVGLLSPP